MGKELVKDAQKSRLRHRTTLGPKAFKSLPGNFVKKSSLVMSKQAINDFVSEGETSENLSDMDSGLSSLRES